LNVYLSDNIQNAPVEEGIFHVLIDYKHTQRENDIFNKQIKNLPFYIDSYDITNNLRMVRFNIALIKSPYRNDPPGSLTPLQKFLVSKYSQMFNHETLVKAAYEFREPDVYGKLVRSYAYKVLTNDLDERKIMKEALGINELPTELGSKLNIQNEIYKHEYATE
jgi:hypothetical protein